MYYMHCTCFVIVRIYVLSLVVFYSVFAPAVAAADSERVEITASHVWKAIDLRSDRFGFYSTCLSRVENTVFSWFE